MLVKTRNEVSAHTHGEPDLFDGLVRSYVVLVPEAYRELFAFFIYGCGLVSVGDLCSDG